MALVPYRRTQIAMNHADKWLVMLASERLAKQISQTVCAVSELQKLRDRVAELEEALGAKLQLTPCRSVHLSPTEEKICGLLLQRPVLTLNIFFVCIYGARPECDQPGEKMLDVWICKLRKKLGPLGVAIQTKWGAGYYLDQESRTKLAALLEDRV